MAPITGRRMAHVNLLLASYGVHWGAWRLPDSDPAANTSLDHYLRPALAAEAAALDSAFIADVPVLLDNRLRPLDCLEPTVVLAAVATVTERIGLIATVSTTYSDPYNVARRLASLDHLSGGRAGWNIVTTCVDAAANFGQDEPMAHPDRYRRATEFTQVCLKLWDSWGDGAVLADQAAGVYADTTRIPPIEHRGEFFGVRGPLQVPPCPQGRPVLVQAGTSEAGRTFASTYAELVFAGQSTLGEAQAFYADIKRRARAQGRDPEQVKVLPGVVTVIGSTQAEADRRREELENLVVDDYALARLAMMLEVPVERLMLDRELPADLPASARITGSHGRHAMILARARREQLTVRELLPLVGSGGGHQLLCGPPERIADFIQEWLTQRAADGFTVMPAVTSVDVDAFVDGVVPELRRRGLLRRSYQGSTLREHYGLDHPRSRPDNASPSGTDL